jgi:hypothetical protein
MERLLTVELGRSRSKWFGKALAEAAYAPLASFLERVRHWRATRGA